jgi:tetrapyrrole methylase family protein/MazG family protein
MNSSKDKIAKRFIRLLETMEKLRGPDGCPWDKAQTPPDLNAHLLEETYEVIEAVDSKDPERLKEELGDLLLQVVFHCHMATEASQFNMGDVMNTLVEKLTRRHPHVFEGLKVEGVKEVLSNWEKIKSEEKKEKGDRSIISGIPTHFPALLKAYRLGEKASRVGFDWSNLKEVLAKTEEELKELEAAIETKDKTKTFEEFGDLLFSFAQTARFLKMNPEEALRHACNKFIRRFHYVEEQLQREKKEWSKTNSEELDRLWNEAKKSTASV